MKTCKRGHSFQMEKISQSKTFTDIFKNTPTATYDNFITQKFWFKKKINSRKRQFSFFEFVWIYRNFCNARRVLNPSNK